MKKEWMEFKAPKPKLKRFYKTVSVDQTEDGWQVLLDGKSIRTPMKAKLSLPTEVLAQAIAAEWEAQGEEILPDSMPMMQFSCAATDYVMPYHEDVLAEATEYAATDVLCYRADAPEDLAQQQYAQWQPLVDWAEKRYGIALRLTTGIMPVDQDEKTLSALRAELQSMPHFLLVAVWLLAKHCSSLLLALAVREGRLSALEAYALSRVDETFQNAHWGEDDEARQKRESGEAEMATLGQFLSRIPS